MDNENSYEENTPNNTRDELYLEQSALAALRTAGKWSRFLAILGFSGLGLMLLLGLFFSSFMSSLTGNSELYAQQTNQMGNFPFVLIGIGYFIIAVIYFFPLLYLYNFGRKILTALDQQDTPTLSVAFENIGKHYRFVGILAIIFLGFYAITFGIGLIGTLIGSAL